MNAGHISNDGGEAGVGGGGCFKARHFVYISVDTTSHAVKTKLISPGSGKRKCSFSRNDKCVFFLIEKHVSGRDVELIFIAI